jgi:hypothetical protein
MWTVLVTLLALTGALTWVSVIYVLVNLYLVEEK